MNAAPRSPRSAGFTLMELLVVTAVIGIVTSFALPRFGKAFEQARADEACAGLESIWRAQRLYHLEHGAPSGSLARLADAGLIDEGLTLATKPFVFALGATPWQATATRAASDVWSGVFTIDATGALGGRVIDKKGSVVTHPKN